MTPPEQRRLSAPLAGHLAALLREVPRVLEARRQAFLEDLELLVNRDSGTYDHDDVTRVAEWARERSARWKARITEHAGGTYADSFAATLTGTPDGPRIVLLAHLDTVFPHGTAAERPFRIEGTRTHGPGVCDMKAGLLAAIYATEALRSLGYAGFGELCLVCTTDEEVGAPSSRGFVEEMAVGARAVLVLEAARANGDLVVQRRGGGFYRLEVTGRSAHAGVEPEKGRSALLTLSRQVVALHALTDLAAGRTVNVGTLHAGIRPNVVPDHAVAAVDLRANTAADMAALLHSVEEALAREALEGTHYTWTPEQFRPPWERNAGTDQLLGLAQQVAAVLGFSMAGASTGGTSDGNFTAALGVPTLDGLGPIGGLDHGPGEYVEIASIVPRTALLAGLIAAIAAS